MNYLYAAYVATWVIQILQDPAGDGEPEKVILSSVTSGAAAERAHLEASTQKGLVTNREGHDFQSCRTR